MEGQCCSPVVMLLNPIAFQLSRTTAKFGSEANVTEIPVMLSTLLCRRTSSREGASK